MVKFEKNYSTFFPSFLQRIPCPQYYLNYSRKIILKFLEVSQFSLVFPSFSLVFHISFLWKNTKKLLKLAPSGSRGALQGGPLRGCASAAVGRTASPSSGCAEALRGWRTWLRVPPSSLDGENVKSQCIFMNA